MPKQLITLRATSEQRADIDARAKAAIILVRMSPEEIQTQQNDDWDYEIAYYCGKP